MKDTFNLREFLTENKLTFNSKLLKEELTPLQQFVYNYEKDISGEEEAKSHLKDIQDLQNADDVYNYYANDRGWEGSMDDDLESIYKQVKRKFKGSGDLDGLSDLQKQFVDYIKSRFGKEEAKKDLELIRSLKTRQELLNYVYDKVKEDLE